MLVKICVYGVGFLLKLESKITVMNNNLSIADFLKITKLDDGSYLSLENLLVLVASSSFSDGSNLNLECFEQVNVSELRDLYKG